MKYALIVSIPRFKDPAIPAISGAGNNLALIRALFAARGFSTVTLSGSTATKSAILGKIAYAASVLKKSPGSFVLYANTHGVRIPSTSEPDGWAEALATYDTRMNVASTTIRDTELASALAAIPACLPESTPPPGNVVDVLLDACFSGGMSPSGIAVVESCLVFSNASSEGLGFRKAILSTPHSYTAACAEGEFAWQVYDPVRRKIFGAFSLALDTELRARPSVSRQEIVDAVNVLMLEWLAGAGLLRQTAILSSPRPGRSYNG
jgi:hypothetical protein